MVRGVDVPKPGDHPLKTCYLQLGRGGDVLNVLPLAWRDHQQTGERSLVMVSQPYASIFEGIGYCDALPVPNRFEDVIGAWPIAEKSAKEHGARLVCTQIYGEGIMTAETCASFMRESWAQVPDAPAWGSLPLVFDRRNLKIEASVRRNLLQNSRGKPYVVVALDGKSSPFAEARTLLRQLRTTLGSDFDIVNISGFIAPRIFDLLGLLEGAHCLLSVDTGILHLAHAVPSLPVVALITREPSAWHGSPWRPQHVARFFYDEMPECAGWIAEAVAGPRMIST